MDHKRRETDVECDHKPKIHETQHGTFFAQCEKCGIRGSQNYLCDENAVRLFWREYDRRKGNK